MTYPIQLGPFFRVAPNWGKPNPFSFSEAFELDRRLTVRSPAFSSSTTTPRGKPSNLWTSWVYSLRSRVPTWLWIRWIQSASQRNNVTSPPKFAMSHCVAKFRSDIQLLHPVTTFSWDIHASLLKRPGPHIHGRRKRSCPQPANTTFATPMAAISHSHIQQCLNRNAARFAQAFSC